MSDVLKSPAPGDQSDDSGKENESDEESDDEELRKLEEDIAKSREQFLEAMPEVLKFIGGLAAQIFFGWLMKQTGMKMPQGPKFYFKPET